MRAREGLTKMDYSWSLSARPLDSQGESLAGAARTARVTRRAHYHVFPESEPRAP